MLAGKGFSTIIVDDLYATDVKIVDHAIGGKMITANYKISEVTMEDFPNESKQHVRRQLVTQLVEEILDHKLVEITQMQELSTGDYHIRARVFLTKDDQVRILRMYKPQ